MIVTKKLPTMVILRRIIDEYQKSTNFPTPTGLLNKLGINHKVWDEIKNTNSPQVQLIEAFFQHIVEHIEKLMLYQPDRFKNYKAYEFILKKWVPSIYGDKKEVRETKQEKKEKQLIDSLLNDGDTRLA